MKNQNSLMLKHTEAAFETCLDRLIDIKGLDTYQDDHARLSADTRRLAVYLVSQEKFKDIPLPRLSAWEEVISLAEQVGDATRVDLRNLFAESGESEQECDTGLADTRTLSDIGFFYERLKEFQVRIKNGNPQVVSAHLKRKRSGTYFTPLTVCEFMVERTLAPYLAEAAGRLERIKQARIIDPAMGTGQFLLAVLDRLSSAAEPQGNDEVLALRRELCSQSIYGIELDEENVEMTHFLLRLYTQGDEKTCRGLVQGDALIDSAKDSNEFGGDGFPEKIFSQRNESFDGFDAIVGNPPYLSAKIQTFSKYKHYLIGATQADFYLLFIQKYAARKYLRPGGGLCFIVPDPLLLRANAESARQRLLESLDLEFLLHIKGVFPRTSVANVVFLARRSFQKGDHLEVARIEKPAQVRSFRRRGAPALKKLTREIPLDYFRNAPRREFRYFLDQSASEVLGKLDTTRPARPGARIVVRSLQTLAGNKAAIFRGEEIGKERVKKLTGREQKEDTFPILLGGESLSKYAVRDDGLFIARDNVKKDLSRYLRHKILLQKSTGRIVAALDPRGYVVPQSVYGILIDDHRIGYPFLLAQLNSRLLNYYMHIMFTGYKLLQPQIEVEDVRQIPIMVPIFEETKKVRNDSLDTAKSLFAQYLRTDDPGWILEYVDDSVKLGSKYGSAMIHDLLDFLGGQMLKACNGAEPGALPRERLEWIIDLVVYRVFGMELDEIETVEGFFEASDAEEAADDPESGEGIVVAETPTPEKPAPDKEGQAIETGGE